MAVGSTARDYGVQLVHYLRKGITFANNGDTVTVGTIPAGALILGYMSGVQVNVAFNGDTTNTLDIGVSGDADLYATDLALGTIAFVPLQGDEAVSRLVGSSPITITALVTSTASASAGSAEIVICYLPNNDG